MVSPVRGHHRRFQAETPLIALCRFAGPALRAFRDAVSASVSRFDGNVAKWMGDGALVYFGYPHAHEDDAERAARAGLALQDALRDLSRDGVPLKARVGIATGLVVAGGPICGSARPESGG